MSPIQFPLNLKQHRSAAFSGGPEGRAEVRFEPKNPALRAAAKRLLARAGLFSRQPHDRPALRAAAKLLLAMVALTPAWSRADRLKYDSQCITIDGNDQVIFSGAFHYFRCPRELWADRFAKLKEAGFNTLETYAAWNYHEQTPPTDPDDYSKLDMTELHDWLAMATDQFGFNVILRPGPYICAEWDGGGYPQWLLAKKPRDFKGIWYRSDDPAYLAWCKHWYTAVAKIAVPFQITHRPTGKAGIILWQIENEYNFWGASVAVKQGQLDFLAHTSRDLGIDVPLTTCLTSDGAFRGDEYLRQNVIETRNTYPKFDLNAMWRDIGMLYQYQPEKFKMITELQGGWFAEVGGKLSEEQGFDETHINQITLYAWENGFTSTNYYMGFGGTNFGDWAASKLTTTYDYDAPLRECGGRTARYFAVKALGEFIADHGAVLARSVDEKFNTAAKTADPHIALRRGGDGSRFIFIRNPKQHTNINGTVDLQINGSDPATIHLTVDLGSFGAKVLYLPPGKSNEADGVWYPKPQTEPARPTDLPTPITVTDIRQKADASPKQWQPFDPSQGEAEAGIYNRQFVFYRTTIPASSAQGKLALSMQYPGNDWTGALLDNEPVTSNDHSRLMFDPADHPRQLTILYENAGRPNFGNTIEQASGVRGLQLSSIAHEPTSISGWKEKHVDRNSKSTAEFSPDCNDSSWASADVDANDGDLHSNGETAIYRARVALADADMTTGFTLTLGRVDDDGYIYVNGQKAGESHDWSVAQHLDITPFLHAGRNTIAVRVVNREGGGGLCHGAMLESTGSPIQTKWELSQQSEGVAGKWQEPALDDAGWTKPKDQQSLLTWYRMKFELPNTPGNEWIPWRLNLDAKGNGFMYLNGHPLGRWWQVGPQHDFFLPECWLNFGPGKTNVITLQLRPQDGPTAVSSATVRPYENMAEMR